MIPSRASVLISLFVGAGLVSWLVVHGEYNSLPALPIIGPITVGLLAVAEISYAFSLRARLRNPGSRPLNAIFVARLAVLGKASSHAAAIVAGLYSGFLAYTLLNLGTPRLDSDSRASAISTLVALALVGAGLFLEYSCRVPREPDDRSR